MTPTESTTKHVVFLAGNDILVDPRVLKYVATLDNFGVRVTAVGLPSKSGAGEYTLGRRARILQVPVPGRVRARRRNVFRRLGTALRPWFSTPAEASAAGAALQFASRELREEAGRRKRQVMGGRRQSESRTMSELLSDGVRRRRLRAWRFVNRIRGLPRRGKTMIHLQLGSRGYDAGAGRRLAVRLHRSLTWASGWRKVLPEAADEELAIGPVLDELRPDVLHVHDVFMLGVAARAAHRAAADGRYVKLVYDAHEYLPGLAHIPARRVAGYCSLEREFMPDVDRVVTVSEPLAELLQRDHDLPDRPVVVLNAPVIGQQPGGLVQPLRKVCGAPEGAPLMVYAGGVNPARGVQTVIDALPHLPGVHFAIVVLRPENYVVQSLLRRAERLGVADRVHLAPYERPEFVTHYFRSATIGISPLLRAPNHDIALTNKFCEYLNADLPVVTSDTPAQAALVRALDLGAVFIAGDSVDCARAVRVVLDDLDRFRSRIAKDEDLRWQFSWAAQAKVLRDLYSELLEGLPEQAWSPQALQLTTLAAQALL